MSTHSIQHNEPHNLPFGERDRSLLPEWAAGGRLDDSWTKSEEFGCPSREVEFLPPGKGVWRQEATVLEELILRFPSAPVFSTHEARSRAYRVDETWPNFHTMRILKRRDRDPEEGIRHVFLLHNGLNETRDISFHYRLADWILQENRNAACVIRPLPGHLTRHFFQSPFTEQPLDEYLQDPASLFRQFLRFMQETQWLLSVLAPRPNYDVLTGCELLLYDEPKPKGRNDSPTLALEICREANHALKESKRRSVEVERGQSSYSPEELDYGDVLDCVETLRDVLGWSESESDLQFPNQIDKPAIHAVGYSMGGFMAQSVFFTWPFVVASCSNLFAGGALRDLAPTAFAHPEEWQSVLHGLRSELDHARAKGSLSPSIVADPSEDSYVVGIKRRTFEYFERVFEGVFLQADRGSYSTRLAEFSRRMLFVLGGEDPIVRTQNVLDAAPPGGINLHQIGDLGHFQDSKQKAPAEIEQRVFWLPEVGGMIGRFAGRAAALLQETHSKYWTTEEWNEEQGAGRESRRKRQPDGGLENMPFEDELDSMIEMITLKGGWLFIARNQIPTVFLDGDAFRTHAAAMHHSEELIGYYANGLAERANKLEELEGGFSLLIPADQVLSDGRSSLKPPDTARDRAMFAKSEVAIRYWPDEKSRHRAWSHFVTNWCENGTVRKVAANEYRPADLGVPGEKWKEKHCGEAEKVAMLILPDAWIAFDRTASEELLEVDFDDRSEDLAKLRAEAEQGLVDLGTKLIEKNSRKIKQVKANQLRGAVRAIKVSPAEFNPRYRGRLLDGSSPETSGLESLLIHWALAYEASVPVSPETVAPPD
jgi:pimeloyl-ACP methyl ester carboxylesterase